MKKYIKPKFTMFDMEMGTLLNSGSAESGNMPPSEVLSRRHRLSNFDDWEDEEPDNSLPRSKSVWDD